MLSTVTHFEVLSLRNPGIKEIPTHKMEPNEPAVVIDNGSGFIKAGMSGEDSPKVIEPSIIGVPRMPGIMVGMDQKDFYVGREAVDKQKFLNSSEPVKGGYIDNWDDMSKIWSYIFFHQLNVSPKEHPIFFCDTPQTPRSAREKMAQVIFEEFEAPNLYMYTQAVLSLFAAGKTTGLVVDSGEGVTHAVPVYEGFALPHGILKVNISGRDLTDYMHKILMEKGFHFATTNIRGVVNDIKEKFCTVAYDFDTELKNAAEGGNALDEYKLPDGSTINIGSEKFVCPEALFQPAMISRDVSGLADSVFHAISKCDADIRKELYGNILLAGGTCMVKRLKGRLEKDVKALAPSTMPIDVIAPPERGYSAWLGGSILSMISSFKSMFISKSEYNEQGALVVYRKCF